MKYVGHYSSKLDLLTACARQATKIRIALLQAGLAVALVTAGPLTAQIELPVSAHMDLYRAGGHDDGSDGLAPAIYSFEARSGKILHFSSVSGSWTCSTAIAKFTADGLPGTTCAGANISGAGLPFSSYYLTDFAGAMAGVFLEDTLPASPPDALRFYESDNSQGGIQTDFKVLSPAIGQTFFIGDGLTRTNTGSIQSFRVPATATHLYLGFVDACTDTSTVPGCYSDNAGTLTAVFRFENHVIDWVEPQLTKSPSTRCCGALAYDAATRSAVLFGGGNGGISPPVRYNDTWIFKPAIGWSEVSPANSPSPRQGAATAYDPTTGTVVLFGGGNGVDPVFNDTWTWDGVNWTEQFPPVSPPGQESDAVEMVYDAATGTVVLWGGSFGSTWEWDGRAMTWTQQFPATSPPAADATIAYDDADKTVVLFGGNSATGPFLNQTWSWDGVTWAERFPASSPSARALEQMTYDAELGTVVLFGGTAGPPSALNDTWTWNGISWEEVRPANQPEGRWAGSMIFDPAANGLLLFGGELVGDPFANDTWYFKPVPVR